MSNFLASGGVVNWQLSKKVSADQSHITVSRAQMSTHRGHKFSADQLTYDWSQAQV